jgi:hypothetical protein
MKNDGNVVDVTGNGYLFELAGYVATCATMALSGEREGSPRYSANRFIEVLRRLIALPRYAEGLKEDPFLERIGNKIENLKLEHVELRGIMMEFADEASNRLERCTR